MIGFYSIWPFFACIALLLALAATPLFAAADTPPSPHANRIVTMDGMRGFLALAVVFHHIAIYHRYLLDGQWQAPPAQFFRLLGPVGVALFFMITGFLFWSQLLRTAGRPAWVTLYVGRLFRIGPLYLAAVAVVLVAVATLTDFHLHVPPLKLARQMIRWLGLGALSLPPVNGYEDTGLLLAGVPWSLQWEWLFYLLLPLLALFARRRGMHLWFVVVSIVLLQAYVQVVRHGASGLAPSFAMLFLLGMLSASLHHNGRLGTLSDHVNSALLLILLVLVFQFDAPTSTLIPQLMLGLILYLVVSGCSLFGLLRSRTAVRLGDVSYGIYLLQGLLLAAVFRWPFSRQQDLISPVAHWALGLLAVVLLVVVATLTHVWIERPGIRAGKRVAKSISSRWLQQPR